MDKKIIKIGIIDRGENREPNFAIFKASLNLNCRIYVVLRRGNCRVSIVCSDGVDSGWI